SAWYDYQISNARVEGINNKIKMIKRKAYGFRDEKYFELILLGLYDETNAIMR
ncbi:transposase, partial [Prevotella intermedia]